MKIPIKKCAEDAILPKIAIDGDAGADCFINSFKTIYTISKKLGDYNSDKYKLHPHKRVLCKLGFAIQIPKGYYASMVPRSGLALWNGLTIMNTPGTIDAGYRNEIGAIVVNLSDVPITLHKDDKICQLIIRKLVDYEFIEVEDLSTSERGLKGFGSTGV